MVVGQDAYVRPYRGQRLGVRWIHSVVDGLARDVVVTGCDAGLQVDDPGVAAGGPRAALGRLPRAMTNRPAAECCRSPGSQDRRRSERHAHCARTVWDFLGAGGSGQPRARASRLR